MPSVNCTPIRTPSISIVVSMGALALLHIWWATQGRLMATESPQSFDSQSSRRLCLLTDRSSSCYVLRYSYGISFYSELAQEHSILYSIRAYDPAFDLTTGRVYPFFLRPRHLITTNLLPLQLYNRFPSFYEYRLYIYTTINTTRWDY
jgi:hypothetical protein